MSENPDPNGGGTNWARVGALATVAGVIVTWLSVAAAVHIFPFGSASSTSSNSTTSTSTATRPQGPDAVMIRRPAHGEHVTRDVEVRGTAKLAGDSQLWLFVQAVGRGGSRPAFYVQTTSPLTPDARGWWQAHAYVGTTGTSDDGYHFTLVARITRIDYADVIDLAIEHNGYQVGAPMSTLPGQPLAQAAVTVVRES